MVEVFYYDAFQKTINPEPEGGPLIRHSAFAELAAESERLRNMLDGYGKLDAELAIAERRIEALSRTGAVKVKALEWTPLSTGWIAHTPFHSYEVVRTERGHMATYANMDFAWGLEDAMKYAAQADFERRILSALADHPRATNTVDAHETANVSDKPEGQQEPVPSEQAVTEAMVVAATEEYFAASFKNTPSDSMRIALKAAMEAGG